MARPPIGATIRRRRQQLGMKTQADLAARIHEVTGLRVSRTSVANWEADVHYPERYIGALEAVIGSLADEEPEVYTDPAERAIWEDPRLPEEVRRETIAGLRRARQQYASTAEKPPA